MLFSFPCTLKIEHNICNRYKILNLRLLIIITIIIITALSSPALVCNRPENSYPIL